MSGVQRGLEREEDRRAWALSVAEEAGVLTTCEFHPDVYLEGNEDIESAYKLADRQLSQGELESMFGSRDEMIKAIDSVVADNNADECYSCEKWKND